MMKHLFFIHSHTLFLTSLGVINLLHLESKNIIFIYSRNYKSAIPVDFKVFDLSKIIEDTFYIMLSWSRGNFFYYRRKRDKLVAEFDELVSKITEGDKYRIYVPHLQNHAFQILSTHQQCDECFFIQEGGRIMTGLLTDKISLFNQLYNKYILRNDNRMWKCSNWFPNSHTPYLRAVTAFAFDPLFFGTVPQRTVLIEWPTIPINISLDSYKPIFLLEGAVELGQVEKSLYLESVKCLIKEYAKDKNYIKFHPIQRPEMRSLVLKFFSENNQEVEELPMDIPFELIISNNKNLSLYGFGTSLLFYGKAFGHKVVSREDLLLKSWRYRLYCKGLSTL